MRGRAVWLLLSATWAGAAGLGLQALLLSLAGLALGYGRAAPLGLALFIAGWALGARLASRLQGSPAPVLLGAGLAVAALGLLGPRALLALGSRAPGGFLAGLVSALAILAVALPQGSFLPLLARAADLKGRGGVAWLLGANLIGAAAGGWIFGDLLPGRVGRLPSAALAGLLAAGAGAAGALAVRARAGAARPALAPEESGSAGGLGALTAGALLALLTGAGGTVEWCGLRLGVLWLGGMQDALSAILVASLAALALGAALAPFALPRGPRAVPLLLGLCALAPTWFLVADRVLGPLGSQGPRALRALLLVGPALAPFGMAVPVLFRALERRDPRGFGGLLGYEAAGALLGIPLSHFVLLPSFGLAATLACWTLAIALALVALRSFAPRALHVAPIAVGAAILFALAPGGAPARRAPPLANPALELLSFEEDEHFAVAVVRDGLEGERTLMTDGFRAAGTGESYRYMRALAHLPLLLHAAPRRVAVLAFGTGTTAGAVVLHEEVEELEILELSAAVVRQARWFEDVNHGVLAPERASGARVRVRLGDGRRSLGSCARAFDLITMEPLLPSSPFAVYLFTPEFYGLARAALAPGGLVCQWVPPHALSPEVFEAVVQAFTSSFPWSSLWLFGTQLVLVGAEEQPRLDPARFPGTGEGALARELAELGIADPAGLLARFVGSGERWPPPERALRDADPWVVHAAMPRGPGLLALLPRNLALLRERESAPPLAWSLASEASELELARAFAALRRAREAQAVLVAEQAGLALAPSLRRDLDRELALAQRLAPADPELAAFARELEHSRARLAGLAALSLDPSPAGARAALPQLLRAAELRPERADAHLFVAVALERMGELEAARAALRRAREQCPRIALTPPGLQARRLGFPATPALAEGFR